MNPPILGESFLAERYCSREYYPFRGCSSLHQARVPTSDCGYKWMCESIISSFAMLGLKCQDIAATYSATRNRLNNDLYMIIPGESGYPCPPLSLSTSLSARQPCAPTSHAPLKFNYPLYTTSIFEQLLQNNPPFLPKSLH